MRPRYSFGMFNGQSFYSSGHLAQMFQRSARDITLALTARNVRPEFQLNGVAYWHASCVAELREYFNRSGDNVQS